MEFKNNLKKKRSLAKFSQEKLAEEMSVSRQTVSKWENGDTYPSTEHIFMLAKILNCTFDELVTGKMTVKNQPSFSPAKSARTKKPLLWLVGATIIFSLAFGYGLAKIIPRYPTLDNQKLATFNMLAEDFLANTTLFEKDTTRKLVGYGVSDENGTFYIKCDVYANDLSGNHCSFIIYFCEDNGNYSYQCQYLENPDYRPSGEYYQIS